MSDDARLTRREGLSMIATGAAATLLVGSVRAGTQGADGPIVLFRGLVALDVETGDVVWTNEDAAGGSDPTVVDGTVYTTTGDELVAVDAATGETVYTVEIGEYATTLAPTVVDGIVYFGAGVDGAAAADAATGDLIWEQTLDDDTPEVTGVAVSAVGDGVFGVSVGGPRDGDVVALDAATGESRWVYDGLDGDTGPVAPTVAGGVVYCGDEAGVVHAIDAESGEARWTFDEPTEKIAPLLTVAYDRVYLESFDGSVYALDAAGGDVAWTFDDLTIGAPPHPGSPTVDDGVVYTVDHDQTLFALDADSGDPIWTGDVVSHADEAPTVYDDTVFVPDPHAPAAYEVATGEQRWRADDVAAYSSWASPTVVADTAGDSVDSRVRTGMSGHHDEWAATSAGLDYATGSPTDSSTDDPGTADGTDGGPDDPSDDNGIPGFGIVSGLAALGGAGYLLQRRSIDED